MADLKARRVLGGRFSADDVLELQLTYTGDMLTCLQHIELISGIDVTHGGGAPATSPLHYKALEFDANEDGIIDYASSNMTIVQASQGTSVVKVVATTMLKSTHDVWLVSHTSWVTDYCTDTTGEDGRVTRIVADGAPDEPAYPDFTIYKSGEITLEWSDDSFV